MRRVRENILKYVLQRCVGQFIQGNAHEAKVMDWVVSVSACSLLAVRQSSTESYFSNGRYSSLT